MIGLVLALSGLILLGAAVALWLRRSRADSGPARPLCWTATRTCFPRAEMTPVRAVSPLSTPTRDETQG
jgi:hypothetical protein